MPGSPAIDAGRLTNCPPFDQRGVERPQGERCDAGAFEVEQGSGPAVIAFISESLVVDRGEDVTLSVTSDGERPLTYQWFFRGLPVAGATGRQFLLGSVDPTNAGNYRVAVTNALGGAVSSNVALGVVVTDDVNFNSECNINHCTLTWQSALNYIYNIQRMDAPDEPWVMLEDTGDFPGTGGVLSFNDLDGPAAMDTRRYRIVVTGRQ